MDYLHQDGPSPSDRRYEGVLAVMSKRKLWSACAVALLTAAVVLTGCAAQEDAEPVLGANEAGQVQIDQDGDPCSAFAGWVAMCRIVAYADMTGDGVANAIGAVLTGAPSVDIAVDLGTAVPTYSPGEMHRGGDALKLGPDLDNLADRQDALLYGVHDVTGDGVPEIVMWIHADDSTDQFAVLQVVGDQLVALPAPDPVTWADAQVWDMPPESSAYQFRCTNNPKTPLKSVSIGNGERTMIPYTWSGTDWSDGPPRFAPAVSIAARPWRGYFDCVDRGIYVERTDADATSPTK